MTGWEAILRAVEQRLRDDLPGKLAEASAEYADTVPLPEPAVYYRHAETDVNTWPAVYIIPDDEATAEVQSGGWSTTLRPFIVAVEFEGNNTADMAAALLRYDKAIAECVLQPPPPAPMHAVLWRRSTPGDVFQPEAGAVFRSWVELKFTGKVFEEHTA